MILKRYVNCIIGIEIITRNIARLYDKVIFMASLCMDWKIEQYVIFTKTGKY